MTMVPRITCANPVTAIGFKGQRNNNNRGGGRRPGFEAKKAWFRGYAIARGCYAYPVAGAEICDVTKFLYAHAR